MTTMDLTALAPFLIVSATALVLLIAIAVARHHPGALWMTLFGLALAFFSLAAPWRLGPRQVTELLLIDPYAVFSIGILLGAAFAIALLAYAYFERQPIPREEFYLLLLLATLGAMILAAATHFASFFLGLELLSVSLYGLNAYLPERRLAVEAGIKYLILAASSTAFLLFGMALIYFGLGVMGFADVIARMNSVPATMHPPLLVIGLVLMLTAIGFKLALVPFHFWTPDVYQGSPAPATAVVASISKAGMFALLLRLFHAASRIAIHPVFVVLSVMAIASIVVGNLLAIRQQRVKRLLAYSSVAHMGYLLIPLLAGGVLGLQAGMLYLVAYLVTTLGAFGVVAMMSRPEQDADELEDFRGLFWRRPTLAVILTIMLLSLAGIPLTAGFLGKFYTVMAGAASSSWGLLLVLVAGSAVGLFYYLRVLFALYTRAGEESGRILFLLPPMPVTGAIALFALTFLIFWLGIAPNLFLHGIHTAIAALLEQDGCSGAPALAPAAVGCGFDGRPPGAPSSRPAFCLKFHRSIWRPAYLRPNGGFRLSGGYFIVLYSQTPSAPRWSGCADGVLWLAFAKEAVARSGGLTMNGALNLAALVWTEVLNVVRLPAVLLNFLHQFVLARGGRLPIAALEAGIGAPERILLTTCVRHATSCPLNPRTFLLCREFRVHSREFGSGCRFVPPCAGIMRAPRPILSASQA